MESEIVKAGAKLEEIMVELSEAQKQYICFTVCGLDNHEAVDLIQRRGHTVEKWIIEPRFREVQEYLLAHKRHYYEEALLYCMKARSQRSQQFMEYMVEKGFDEIKKTSPNMAIVRVAVQCAEHIDKVVPITRGGVGESYDELILKRHLAK